MTNLPINFQNGGALANPEDLAQSLGNMASGGEGSQGLDGRELMRLDKHDGLWLYGQDGTEFEEGDQIAVNPSSFKHGYISWKKREVVGEKMAPISQPVPSRDDLPETGAKWDEQLQFDAQLMNGPDAGVMLLYKSTALGGKECIRTLARRIVAQIQQNPQYPVPVISLSSTSYEHKEWGTIYKPVFNIVEWLDYDGNPMQLIEEAPEDGRKKPVRKPKASERKVAPKQEAQPEPEPEAAPEPETLASEPETPAAKPSSRRRRRQG